VLGDDPQGLEPALAAHQATLEGRIRQLAGAVEKVRDIRASLAQGKSPTAGEWCASWDRRVQRRLRPSLALGGERFELSDVRPLNYIIGPLGSGKTRLARRLAETLPDAVFLGLDRLEHGSTAVRARLESDPALQSRVDQTLSWLVEDGAAASEALVCPARRTGIEGAAVVVVDMVEQGLDQAAQEALIAHLRRRGPAARPLFLLTRSCAILDLAAVGPKRRSFSVPPITAPDQRRPISRCPRLRGGRHLSGLAEVRARTEGVIAWRPKWREAASRTKRTFSNDRCSWALSDLARCPA